MFNQSIDERLSAWSAHRQNLNSSANPFGETWEFWKDAPYVPYNHKIDRYYQREWPSPWEIIVENRYDDFTRALMIGWSIKLTDRFKDSRVEVRSLVDNLGKLAYNVVYVNDEVAINYLDNGPVSVKSIPESLLVENLIEVKWPR